MLIVAVNRFLAVMRYAMYFRFYGWRHFRNEPYGGVNYRCSFAIQSRTFWHPCRVASVGYVLDDGGRKDQTSPSCKGCRGRSLRHTVALCRWRRCWWGAAWRARLREKSYATTCSSAMIIPSTHPTTFVSSIKSSSWSVRFQETAENSSAKCTRHRFVLLNLTYHTVIIIISSSSSIILITSFFSRSELPL